MDFLFLPFPASPLTIYRIACCPVCSFWSDVARTTLLNKGIWRSVPCGKCKAPRSASKWKCSCDKLWTNCTVHCPIGRLCGGSTKSKAGPVNPRRSLGGFDVDHNGYPVDLPRRVKKFKVCSARAAPPPELEFLLPNPSSSSTDACMCEDTNIPALGIDQETTLPKACCTNH